MIFLIIYLALQNKIPIFVPKNLHIILKIENEDYL